MAQIDGATVIARSLKTHGIQYCFGIVGIPVVPVAEAMQREGLTWAGMRHEQSATYAAGVIGYLTGRPGVALTVGGPGMMNAMSGMGNARANNWPLLVLSGSNATYEMGMGAFQEAPLLDAAKVFCKYAARPESVARLPYYVEQALRTAWYGRPGPAFLELTDDIISGTIEESEVVYPPAIPEPPRPPAPESAIESAMAALRSAETPLVIIGKGAAYARAEDEIRQFVETTQVPFLASPMGSGVLPDDHALSAGAARSLVLQGADLIFLVGARLNWMMHFGQPPRFKPNVRVIQLDIAPEEIGANVPTEVALVGDAKVVMGQLNAYLEQQPWSYPEESTWRTSISKKIEDNRAAAAPMLANDSSPLGFYRAFKEVNDLLPDDAIVVAEGANTMDISRQVILNRIPRRRLDAGSWGTMGVGLPQAIAAALVHPERRVIAIEGDSAFGFSASEVEVACRLGLPITFIIFNNNGIYGGPDELMDPKVIPPGALYPNAHYEKFIEAFGGLGFFVDKPDDLGPAVKKAFDSGKPSIINVMISTQSRRRTQEFSWNTSASGGQLGATTATPAASP